MAEARQLWRAVKNASLFTRTSTADGKTLNGGEAMFHLRQRKLLVVGALNHASVATTVPVDAEGEWEVFLPAKALKELEKELRDMEGEVALDLSLGDAEAEAPEFWEGLRQLSRSIGRTPSGTVQPFEIDPDVLSQFSRLEPKGQWPLSLRGFVHDSEPVVAYRYGPDCYGVVVPLQRERLVEKGLTDGLWFATT